MKPHISYNYYSDTHRLMIFNEITDGETRSIDQETCEVCNGWTNIDDIIERSEHRHCEGDKCKEVVNRIIFIEQQDYQENY